MRVDIGHVDISKIEFLFLPSQGKAESVENEEDKMEQTKSTEVLMASQEANEKSKEEIKSEGILETPKRGIVGIAKHLCGGATDLALCSLSKANPKSQNIEVKGIIIAPCNFVI